MTCKPPNGVMIEVGFSNKGENYSISTGHRTLISPFEVMWDIYLMAKNGLNQTVG